MIPLHKMTDTYIKKLRARISKRSSVVPNGCILWNGTTCKKGYGHIGLYIDKKLYTIGVHRVVYALENNMAIAGHILHKCDTPSCINASHLFKGTNLDNVKDKVAKGRHPSGSASAMSKLTNGQVINIRLRYMTGKYTKASLGREFGVCRKTIYNIIQGLAYNNVK